MESEAPDDRQARAAGARDARLAQPPLRALADPDDSRDSHRRAFAELYERFYDMILNYAFRRTLNVAAAEEVTSNTFFKALRALSEYRADQEGGQSGQPMQAWLYAIATNELRMHWRWRRRHPMRSLEELDADQQQRVLFDSGGFSGSSTVGGRGGSLLDEHEERERRMMEFARVHEGLSQLPERYQTVLSLRYFEQLSLEEIAEVTGRPLGSVKSRLHRATAKLKSILQRTATATTTREGINLPEMVQARAAIARASS